MAASFLGRRSSGTDAGPAPRLVVIVLHPPQGSGVAAQHYWQPLILSFANPISEHFRRPSPCLKREIPQRGKMLRRVITQVLQARIEGRRIKPPPVNRGVPWGTKQSPPLPFPRQGQNGGVRLRSVTLHFIRTSVDLGFLGPADDEPQARFVWKGFRNSEQTGGLKALCPNRVRAAADGTAPRGCGLGPEKRHHEFF